MPPKRKGAAGKASGAQNDAPKVPKVTRTPKGPFQASKKGVLEYVGGSGLCDLCSASTSRCVPSCAGYQWSLHIHSRALLPCRHRSTPYGIVPSHRPTLPRHLHMVAKVGPCGRCSVGATVDRRHNRYCFTRPSEVDTEHKSHNPEPPSYSNTPARNPTLNEIFNAFEY
jgi:hypothetical protein